MFLILLLLMIGVFSNSYAVDGDKYNDGSWRVSSSGVLSPVSTARADFAAINATSIGATTPGSGVFTTISSTGNSTVTDLIIANASSTSGIGSISLGSISTAKALKVNPGATVVGETINISHTLGAGDCDDLLASYKKISVLGDGDSGLTAVGDAPRVYVGLTGGSNNSVASAAYASQPWVKHGGTGAITAMSGVSAMLDVGAENFTANTVNAGHFHIQGAGDVAAQYDGVMIEAYPDVDTMDSLLALVADSGADVATAIRIVGSSASEMTLSSGAKIYTGTAATRAAVRAQVGDTAPLGSMYIGVGAVATTKPYTYIKVVNGPGDTDWERVVTQASD
jgi:hypothetical protein